MIPFDFELECTDQTYPFKWTRGTNTLCDSTEQEQIDHPNEIKVHLYWSFTNSEGLLISMEGDKWFPESLSQLVTLEKGRPILNMQAYNQYLIANTKFKIKGL